MLQYFPRYHSLLFILFPCLRTGTSLPVREDQLVDGVAVPAAMFEAGFGEGADMAESEVRQHPAAGEVVGRDECHKRMGATLETVVDDMSQQTAAHAMTGGFRQQIFGQLPAVGVYGIGKPRVCEAVAGNRAIDLGDIERIAALDDRSKEPVHIERRALPIREDHIAGAYVMIEDMAHCGRIFNLAFANRDTRIHFRNMFPRIIVEEAAGISRT